MSQICLRLYLTSDGGSFCYIPSLSVGDTVGSAIMSAAGGAVNFNTRLNRKFNNFF